MNLFAAFLDTPLHCSYSDKIICEKLRIKSTKMQNNFIPFIRVVFPILMCTSMAHAFSICPRSRHQSFSILNASSEEDLQSKLTLELDPTIAEQFKIITCSSTACSKRSIAFGLDEYALFSGIYERKEENQETKTIEVEEGSCMGRCKFGPCIGVEHEDYQGKVALEGMTSEEFQNRVFQK